MTTTDSLAFDRVKTCSWWTGRISNADLATWTGQTERDVRLILDTPYMRGQIQGGGRGSKNTRRITRQARNAVAIVAALRKAGFPIEVAANIFNVVPVLASFPTEAIDFSPNALEALPAPYGSIAMLAIEDPEGGWLPTDIVPRHVFDLHCRPIVRAGAGDRVEIGSIGWLPDWQEKEFGIPDGWIAWGDPIYRPEIDLLGLYEHGNAEPDANDQLDNHFYIINGRWIWARYSDPNPRTYLLDIFQHIQFGRPRRFSENSVTYSFEPIAEILPGNTVKAIQYDSDTAAAARRAWEQFHTKLDVNASVAIRDMKRVALGTVAPP